jgi:hypothetical protein
VRGLNEEDKCLRVINLLRDCTVDVVCFQETKLEVMSCSVVFNLWGFPSCGLVLFGFQRGFRWCFDYVG